MTRFELPGKYGRLCHTRRSLLLAASAGLVSLAGCADQSSDRRFAGDRRTDEAIGTTASGPPEFPPVGSPTATPKPLPIAELLAPRGARSHAIIAIPDRWIVVDLATGTGKVTSTESRRAIWAGQLAGDSSRVALLTSRSTSPVDWAVVFADGVNAESNAVEIGDWSQNGEHEADVVAGGRGGIGWLPDAGSVVVGLPTGGLLQVFPDGSQVRLAKAAVAKRPSELAVSPDGSTLAFVDQQSGGDGSGVFAGSMKAKPIDPVVVLPADRSGNRYARGVAWVGDTARVVTIIDREETGATQGDLFMLDTHTRQPRLVWTSPIGRDVASVESFAISPDALVTAFLTNSIHHSDGKSSSVWLKQTGGPTIERFDLPMQMSSSQIVFSERGLVVTGIARQEAAGETLGVAILLDPNGRVTLLYQEESLATPVASPPATPVASPAPASPTASE